MNEGKEQEPDLSLIKFIIPCLFLFFMAKYKCTVCDYVYDESKGDPEHDVKKGTRFDDLPDDWVCPVCGVPKSLFKKIE